MELTHFLDYLFLIKIGLGPQPKAVKIILDSFDNLSLGLLNCGFEPLKFG
jgi:hypothetical protein